MTTILIEMKNVSLEDLAKAIAVIILAVLPWILSQIPVKPVGWIDPGTLTAIVTIVMALLTALFGGVFIHYVSGKYTGKLGVLKTLARTFFAWAFSVKVLAVVVLIAIGFALIILAPRATVLTIHTGNKYLLDESSEPRYISDYWCKQVLTPAGSYEQQCGFTMNTVYVYKYDLLEFKIYSDVPLWWLDPGMFLAGLAFITLGLLLSAFWLSKENNKLYGQV